MMHLDKHVNVSATSQLAIGVSVVISAGFRNLSFPHAFYMRIQNPGARIQNETKPLSDILKRFSCFVVTGFPVMGVSGNPEKINTCEA